MTVLLTLHPVDRFVLIQHLVVFRQRHKENERRNVLKAVDPFLTFTPLPSDIKQAIREVADTEHCFGDTGRLDARAEDVLVIGKITWLCHSLDGVEVAT
jgi:hypothetical protein